MGVGVSRVGLLGRDIIVSAPESLLLRSGARGWVGYALLLGQSSAALSNGKCPLFSAFVSKAAYFSMFLYLRF